MLLATYALATLTIERTCERKAIVKLQDCMVHAAESLDCSELSIHSERLILLAESRHWRRWEESLLPALRDATAEAGPSMQSAEELARLGIDMLAPLRDALEPGAQFEQLQLARACERVNGYCENLLLRLNCEEELLVPLARRVLPLDTWFKLGTEFLRQDAELAACGV
jgi:hypothetical protein